MGEARFWDEYHRWVRVILREGRKRQIREVGKTRRFPFKLKVLEDQPSQG